jgi:hypothetical protein
MDESRSSTITVLTILQADRQGAPERGEIGKRESRDVGAEDFLMVPRAILVVNLPGPGSEDQMLSEKRIRMY